MKTMTPKDALRRARDLRDSQDCANEDGPRFGVTQGNVNMVPGDGGHVEAHSRLHMKDIDRMLASRYNAGFDEGYRDGYRQGSEHESSRAEATVKRETDITGLAMLEWAYLIVTGEIDALAGRATKQDIRAAMDRAGLRIGDGMKLIREGGLG